MAINIYFDRTTLTGGGSSALDGIDGASLNDGDKAFVYTSADILYVYILDADSGQGENSPYIISPDLNPGSKRWILQSLPAQNSGNPQTFTAYFTGFSVNPNQTKNITGLPNNNPVIRKIKLWITSDPGGDWNGWWRLAFYTHDTMSDKDQMITQFFFNLTYTEIKTAQWNASGSGGDVDSTTGLNRHDMIRLLGGTAEETRITTVTDNDTLAVSTITYNHAVDTGVVKVMEIPGLFQLQDIDSTNEIHLRLSVYDTPIGPTNVYVSLDIQ